jgi:RNA polymerase sigma factor (TIGR02999 family)
MATLRQRWLRDCCYGPGVAPADLDRSVRALLSRWHLGDADAGEQLTPTIYAELRVLANRFMRRETPGHTLQPTALVNEACLRLLGSQPETRERSHFVALAARTMRQVLIDHARRKHAAKRAQAQDRVELATGLVPVDAPRIEILALDQALNRLAEVSPRAAKLVEIRFFGGLDNEEAAEVLGVSLSTVEREWRAARAWLREALSS